MTKKPAEVEGWYERPRVHHFRRTRAYCPLCEKQGLEDNTDFHNGLLRCKRHGCTFRAGEWEFVCEECGAEVEELHGIPTPYLCKTCLDRAPLCGICRRPRPVCCC
jgi:hypothetical protein